MKSNLLLFLLVFMLPLTTFSQARTEDVVYLKNGSIIRGTIVEQILGESLKIELLGGSIFVFQQSEIDSIKKETALNQKSARAKHDYFRKDKGYRNMSEMSLICGFGTNDNYYYGYNPNDYGFSLQTVNGYQWSRWIYTGVGIGIDRFITYKQTFAPFYFRASSEFLKKRITPYAFADIGYVHMLQSRGYDDFTNNKNRGGLYFASGGGVRFYTRSHTSVSLSVSYRRYHSSSEWTYDWEGSPIYNIDRQYQRVVFGVGVGF